ncbi:MAG: serine/threonine protein kinase [Verrucomicrobiales bacterium]|jgi:serine/threonine protein kinase
MEGEVARGGMGAIHLAEDPALRRRVAVKTMLSPDATSDELVRFVEEAQITGQHDHPGIVPVYELGVNEAGDPFYSMKFVHGRDLYAILGQIRKGDPLVIEEFPLHRLLMVFDRVCDAVAFAHAHGVIHRDLKPGNIRIGEFGEVLVMDWGLAKLLGHPEDEAVERDLTRHVSSVRDGEESAEFATLAGSIMGSPQYMAPEQAAGENAKLDARSDIYALGAILYEILALRSPIQMEADEDIYAVLARSSAGQIEPPVSTKARRVPEALAKVAMKALALDRDDRYESVGALQREITAWLGGFATDAENAGLLRQLRLFVRRHKVASTAAAMIALLLVVGSAINWRERNAAVTAKGEAEGALAKYEESERQKAEQARKSAPTYLKSALALELQGDFDDALITTEGALGFDSKLTAAYRVRSLLLARAGSFEEALADAQKLPNSGTDAKLRSLLEAIIADPGTNRLPALAKLAGEVGMPSTATDLLAQSWKIFEGHYAEALPIWRAKLEKAWGLQLSSYEFGIDPTNGLQLRLGEKFKSVATSLESVRGIPLESLVLTKVNISDLSPLRGMPLRHVETFHVPLRSLSGLEEAPLESLKIDEISGRISTEMLRALRGKKIDYLHLGGAAQSETQALSEVQCRDLWIAYPNSFSFIRNQTHLENLYIYFATSEPDWSPVFECPTLKKLAPMHTVHQATMPIWLQIANGDLKGARSEVEDMRASIQNPACQRTRMLLDLMAFLIDHKLGAPATLTDGRALITDAENGRTWGMILIHVPAKFHFWTAFEKLDVDIASVHSEEDLALLSKWRFGRRLVIGGYRTENDPKWRWSDGTPWDFDRLPPAQSKLAIEPGYRQRCGIDQAGQWIAMNRDGMNGHGVLIQFPTAWLEGTDSEQDPQ